MAAIGFEPRATGYRDGSIPLFSFMAYKDKYDPRARKARRKWYRKNKDRAIASVQKRRRRMRKWLTEYRKTLVCEICGEDDFVCLDFHHRKDKIVDISRMVTGGYSKKRILEEISKCDVLCANCHRKLHAGHL